MTDLPPGEAEKIRDFLRRWRETGPLLEEMRYRKLEALTDEEARHICSDLFKLWRPPTHDKLGEELVAQQRVFSRYRERANNPDDER